MSKYAEGKIYKIISDQTDMIYVGSTSEKYLSSRLNRHRIHYRSYVAGKHCYITSFEILKYDDSKIILLELYPCQCREQLLAKEQSYIDMFKSKIVNKQNASGLDLERVKERKRQYYEKEGKQYREANKDVINARRRIEYACACGDIITIGSKARHERTTRHKMLIQIKENLTAENI